MADSSVPITAGTGTAIDTRTEGTNGDHRQVVVIGDPATNAGVAPVDSTNGLAVQVIPALPAGTNAIGKLAANSGVDIGDTDVTSVIPGTGATNLGKAEDAAHTTGDVGVMALTVRSATAVALAGTTLDYQPLITDPTGQLYTTAQIANGQVAIGAIPSNPVHVGAVAATTNPAAVVDTKVVNVMADDLGRLVVVPGHVRDLVTHATTTITSSTAETTVLAAGAAGVFHDITLVTIANSSATAALVSFKDATAGTTRINVYVPAGQTAGFVAQIPIPQAAAAANWTATSSASVASLYIFVQAIKNV